MPLIGLECIVLKFYSSINAITGLHCHLSRFWSAWGNRSTIFTIFICFFRTEWIFDIFILEYFFCSVESNFIQFKISLWEKNCYRMIIFERSCCSFYHKTLIFASKLNYDFWNRLFFLETIIHSLKFTFHIVLKRRRFSLITEPATCTLSKRNFFYTGAPNSRYTV
jgi:hypothetical protein